MDIKIGTTSVGEDASSEKREKMKAKDDATTTTTLGMRISGLRVFQCKRGEYVAKDKPWGKKVKDSTMGEALSTFFHNGEKIRSDVVAQFITRLKQIKVWMDHQKDLRFYSSSLLFLYEGDENSPLKTDIRMIDFAHVHAIKDGGRDEGYILGLNNTIKFFEKLSH